MDFVRLVEIAPAYIGLIIFVWYTITRDREWRTWLKEINELWLTFLKSEQEQRLEVMTEIPKALAEHLIPIFDHLRALTESITKHHATAEKRHEAVMEMLKEIRRGQS